ncbi:beta strand repeat-containing protein, partial [Undibacterium sp. Ji49W]|uniref:beta strand repeat-containing protein n=1 Tax=Undibacterium sp. Ji49W TaxID=3413040 RepID=UPI003BF024DC
GVFNGVAGINENFTGTAATLAGTTVNGNAGDTDAITLSGAVNLTGAGNRVNGGGIGGTISNIKILNLGNGSNNIEFANATSGITTLNGGTGDDTVNFVNTGTTFIAGTVNLGNGNNILYTDHDTYTGTYTAGSGTNDQLTLQSGTNISGATVSGFENLNLNFADVTMTVAQYNSFTTINGSGTEQITFSTAGTINGNTTIENYVLANGNNFFSGTTGLVSVTGGTGNDNMSVPNSAITGATRIDGGLGFDGLTILNGLGAALDISTLVSNVEAIGFYVGANPAWTFINENGVGVSLNVIRSSNSDLNNVTLGSGGQVLNMVGTATGNTTITGGSGKDTINLSASVAGNEAIVTGSVISAIDTVVNFKVAGIDVFKTGTAATTLNALNIATADTATFAAAIATAATAAGAALASNTQAYLVTVSAGTAAGIYAFQNIGGTTGTVDATDFIIKIVGAGTILVGDFVA